MSQQLWLRHEFLSKYVLMFSLKVQFFFLTIMVFFVFFSVWDIISYFYCSYVAGFLL